MSKDNKKININNNSSEGEKIVEGIDLLGALQYSKAELQQADSKINTMLVVNSILIATLVSISLGLQTNIDWRWYWIFPFFIFTNLLSVGYLCWGLFPSPSDANADKSPFFWAHMIDGVDVRWFEQNYLNNRIMETLEINSNKSQKKYLAIQKAVMISCFPITPFVLFVKLIFKRAA